MKYALVGYGRMGQAVERQARSRGHECTAVVDPATGNAKLDPERLGGARMAFEFTLPGEARGNLEVLFEAGVSVVCGTTGWRATDELRGRAERCGVGCLFAPNFALGVHLFFRVVEHAARVIGALGLHHPFVHEAHHRGKADAPSGTARRLASIVVEATPGLESVVEGHPPGRLAEGALQVVGTRAGSEPGTHRVGFDGEHDVITLEHRARGREGLALGAVLAAEWLEGRRGWFDFDDVLEAILRGELRARGDEA
jgi:4-hydroxy-tetrahydrodipicolinate reductase